jgi:hypothetical protein
MSDAEVEELIERHIEFTDGEQAVHLPAPFVRHYQRRDDGALPFIAAIATLPIASADGYLICADGLDHERGIVFNVDLTLTKSLPDRLSCDRETVGDALRFLLTEWLCDVATDFTGKYTLVALALTVIERSLLDERPTFFVTAGRRGGGKTTALKMVLGVVTGRGSALSALASPPRRKPSVLPVSMIRHSKRSWKTRKRRGSLFSTASTKSSIAFRPSSRLKASTITNGAARRPSTPTCNEGSIGRNVSRASARSL